jgi:hypothetical protein
MKIVATAAIGLCAAGIAWSQEKERPVERAAEITPGRVVILEEPGDAPAPPSALGEKKTAATKTVVEHNGHISVQVNVAEGGVNILDDAANEPSIAVDPTAPLRMAIGWRHFRRVSSNFREAGYGWSADGGRSWTAPEVLTPGIFRSDPVLAANADGRFYYYSLISNNGILCDMFTSEDAGETWSRPIPAAGGDKAWFAVDTTDGPGRGNIYVSWSTDSNQFGQRIFIRSFDDGLSYTDPIALIPAPIWGTLTIGVDGEVYIAGNAAFNRNMFVVYRSMNALDSQVEPPRFDSFLVPLGGRHHTGGDYSVPTPNPVGLLGQVWIAADHSHGPNRGDLYIVASVDPPGGDPLDVHFVRSSDGGESWSQPVRINTDDRNAWQWFGTMSVAPNGRIDVVWVESFAFTQPQHGALYYAASVDGGSSWTTPEPITPGFNSWLGWPNQNKLGDYFDMVSDDVGADLAYAATFNGEQDVYYLRIGDTDCNRNGVGDEEDLAAGLADCNDNSLLDSCEIAAETAIDSDGDGVIDDCRPAPRRAGRRVGG